MFLIYPFYALASLFFAVLTFLLAPVLALLVGSDGNLPKPLYWFQTFDNPVTAGMVAPYHWPYSEYVCKIMWLWRNPAYGFDMFLLGLQFNPTAWTVVKDEPDCFFAYSKGGAFSFRGKYFKFGWKAWARLSGTPNWVNNEKIPVCFWR